MPQERAKKIKRLRPPAGHAPMADSTFVLTGSYYDVRGRWTSRLTLNNKGADETRPTVTLFSPKGEAYTVPGILVGGNDFLELDLGAVVQQAGPRFRQGSIRVTYYGKRLEMGAQVVVADLDAGIQFDEQLSYTSPTGSRRREGVWWRPTAATRLSVVLTNRGEEAITVRAGIEGSVSAPKDAPGSGRRAEIGLGPRELRVVEFGAGLEQAGRLGGVTLEVEGAPGALLARGFVADPAIGYSASVAFADPTTAKTPTYHGAGARLHTSSGAATEPVVVARNVGSAATTLQGRVTLSLADGGMDVLRLPDTPLGPGETARLAAGEAWRQASERPDVTAAGVEFTYASAPGSVIMSAAAVGPDRNDVFQVPLIDPETPPSSTGGYPWRAGPADGPSTVVYLKNTTAVAQTYLLQVSFSGGAYAPGLKTLAAGETLALDLRHLRDAQVPDRLGRTIPLGVDRGQVHWSAKSRDRHAMIGRAETVDAAQGVSATYACVNCCPDNPYESWFEPEDPQISIGSSESLAAWLRDIDCYDTILEAYDLGPGQLQWSSSNTSVATVSGGNVTAVGDGTAYIFGDYWTDWYFEEQNTDCEFDPYLVAYEGQAQVQCAVPANLTRVSANSSFQDGKLQVTYSWQSSFGALSNINACKVAEVVEYPDGNPFSWPAPFQVTVNNPATTPPPFLEAGLGTAVDTHVASPSYSTFTNADFTATQHYVYMCPCKADNMAIHNFSGALQIRRRVFHDGAWKYRIDKGTDYNEVQIGSLGPLPVSWDFPAIAAFVPPLRNRSAFRAR